MTAFFIISPFRYQIRDSSGRTLFKGHTVFEFQYIISILDDFKIPICRLVRRYIFFRVLLCPIVLDNRTTLLASALHYLRANLMGWQFSDIE